MSWETSTWTSKAISSLRTLVHIVEAQGCGSDEYGVLVKRTLDKAKALLEDEAAMKEVMLACTRYDSGQEVER